MSKKLTKKSLPTFHLMAYMESQLHTTWGRPNFKPQGLDSKLGPLERQAYNLTLPKLKRQPQSELQLNIIYWKLLWMFPISMCG